MDKSQAPTQTAVVTGGAVRLGKAIALALARRGMNLAIHYNASAGAARALVQQIRDLGQQAIALQVDLGRPALAPKLIEQTVAQFGRVDLLVNNAAIFEPGEWYDTDQENWDRHMNINLKSPFFLAQAFARQANGQRDAQIINIGDWRGERPGAHYIAYTLTKAALIAMTQSLAQALAPTIRVNAIAPGLILPPPGEDERYLEQEALKIPAQRAGSTGEIVKALSYLLDADFVTGEVLHVTGGEHLLVGRET